jgi:hypothetical protein
MEIGLPKLQKWGGVQEWVGYLIPNKRGTNLETKFLGVRHISRLKVIYLGLSNSISKLSFQTHMVST